MNTRSIAIQWWKDINGTFYQLECGRKYYPGRDGNSLTGREIERMYTIEKSTKLYVVLENLVSGLRFWSTNSDNNTHSFEGEHWYKEIVFTNNEEEALKYLL